MREGGIGTKGAKGQRGCGGWRQQVERERVGSQFLRSRDRKGRTRVGKNVQQGNATGLFRRLVGLGDTDGNADHDRDDDDWSRVSWQSRIE